MQRIASSTREADPGSEMPAPLDSSRSLPKKVLTRMGVRSSAAEFGHDKVPNGRHIAAGDAGCTSLDPPVVRSAVRRGAGGPIAEGDSGAPLPAPPHSGLHWSGNDEKGPAWR